MTLRTLINVAVSIVIALALIFIARGLAGSIFNVKPPEKPAIALPSGSAAAPAKKAQKAAEKPAAAQEKTAQKKEEKPAAAEKPAPAEQKTAQAEAAKPAPAEQAAPAAAASGGGDVAAGKKVFKKCKSCHFPDKKKNKIGPYLLGVVGRKVAAVEGFKYSEAMKAAAGSLGAWTEENLKGYLMDPRKFIPKNKMSFTGLKKDKDIADVIAYLKSMK